MSVLQRTHAMGMNAVTRPISSEVDNLAEAAA
jgi:hypothetical protein